MFSARFPDLSVSRWSRAIDAARARGPLLDLTTSNPTEVQLERPDQASAILGALADPRLLRYQPEPQGLVEARQAIAAFHTRAGRPMDPDRLFLCASTSEAYGLLFKLLCDAGQRVLAPSPSYPLLDHLSRFEGVYLDRYPLRYHAGWFIDADELARRVTLDTRALLVVSPNNPTGSYVKAAEWEALARVCRARDMALISDEVFYDYALAEGGPAGPSAALGGEVLTFTLGGLSKLAGLPQLKLSWIYVSGPRDQVAAALPRLELLADSYLSVGAPVQLACARLLALGLDRAIRERVRRNHQALERTLRTRPVQLYQCEGGWSAILRLPNVPLNDERYVEEEWMAALLDEAGVLVQPGWLYDFEEEPVAVVSLLVEPALFDEGIARLIGLVERKLG